MNHQTKFEQFCKPAIRDQIRRWPDAEYATIPPVLLVTAGFEDRCLALVRALAKRGEHIDKAYVLDYSDVHLNEPVRTELITTLKQVAHTIELIPMPQSMGQDLVLPPLERSSRIAVDISGMDRVILFQVLHSLDRADVACDIFYTEAEEYYPKKAMYETLVQDNAPIDKAFANYLAKEKTEFAYSYDCSLVQPANFRGDPEPGKPFMLIAFFAFKRSRLQLMLQTLEAERKLFLLSQPIREDLKWRKDFMKIANWDLIRKNTEATQVLPTLYPNEVAAFLEDQTYRDLTYAKYNIVLAPLGSKMQTLGCYCFWRRHKDISVMFTHPHRFFPKTYSRGYRDTFVVPFEKLCKMPVTPHMSP